MLVQRKRVERFCGWLCIHEGRKNHAHRAIGLQSEIHRKKEKKEEQYMSNQVISNGLAVLLCYAILQFAYCEEGYRTSNNQYISHANAIYARSAVRSSNQILP